MAHGVRLSNSVLTKFMNSESTKQEHQHITNVKLIFKPSIPSFFCERIEKASKSSQNSCFSLTAIVYVNLFLKLKLFIN